MQTRQSVSFVVVALMMCLALGSCGSSGFGWSLTCPSTTECTVVVQNPATNSDAYTWSVTTSDSRVRIAPSHGVIAPGQRTTVTLTIPFGACGIQLTGSAQDAVWPMGLGGSAGFGATVPDMMVATSGAPDKVGPGTCVSTQAMP